MSTELVLSGGHKLKITTNYPLAGSSDPERALIVIHGTDRNADDYHRWALDAARKAGATKVLVVAPRFDSAWDDDDWKDGDGGPVSSYAALDQLLGVVAARFPNVKRIVVTGHSAGGQVTQRYAAVGNAPTVASYAILNPSSYAYLDSWRPVAVKNCTPFNRWKYGLDRRGSGYVGELTADQVAARYVSRTVVIANGSLDVKNNHSMDASCAANVQGKHRSARGRAFADRIRNLYPDAPHSYIVVPGVGHDGQAMLSAPVLRPALFGTGGP